MGDFAFPCFRLAKAFRKAPPMIAQDLKETIGEQPFLSEIKVVGGYLNFYVDKAQYAKQIIDKYLAAESYGASKEGNDKTVCIDYSSPNVAKNFHVGHLRTTLSVTLCTKFILNWVIKLFVSITSVTGAHSLVN